MAQVNATLIVYIIDGHVLEADLIINAEFYAVLPQEQKTPHSVQIGETAWLISFKGTNEDEERGEGLHSRREALRWWNGQRADGSACTPSCEELLILLL